VSDPRVGDRIGRFELVESIGRGGNALVFRARDAETDVALKVLKTRKVDSEPYSRFRREIETVRSLGRRGGVLPVLDSHLPEKLGRGDRAWLAMPLATRIDHALTDAELPAIVRAVASLAATLASLRADIGLVHRDLKPQNLYVYEDSFAVGDFGLVALPDAEHLTAPGKVIGPANFVAYEMMERPLESDPAPADVYSIAKTLWVLATGQRWPPPGHQPAGQSPSIGQYRPHAQAPALDRLIDRATQLNAAERPTMSAFADDLEVWLEQPPPPPGLADLSAVGAELRRRVAPEVEASAARDRLHAAVYALSERLERRLEPATEVLREAYPNVASADGSWLTRQLGTRQTFGSRAVVGAYAVGATLRWENEKRLLVLRYGALLELLEDARIRVSSAISVGHDDTLGGGAQWMGEATEAAAESLAAEHLIDAAANELVSRLPEFAAQFAERMA
jgi:Protein kinase domain